MNAITDRLALLSDQSKGFARFLRFVINCNSCSKKTGSTPGASKHLPAVSMWSDFDDRHGKDCISLKSTISVHANMSQPNNGQALLPTQDNRPRYTGELLLRTRPKVYRQIVRLLSEGVSANQICKLCHVTRETVRAVERREVTEISARKKSIVGILGNVAELGASRMEETIGKASLRDAAIGTGIAVDKILALSGQLPGVQVAVVNMPSETERAEMRAIDAKLCEIAARLKLTAPPSP